MKKSFVESSKFPLLTMLIMLVVTTGAYAVLKPTGADISNLRIVEIFKLAGWFTGFVMAILSFILFKILHAIGNLLKLCKFRQLHGPAVLVAVLPWLIMSWQITAEPRYTNIAKAIIDFIARPMLWGSLTAALFALVVSLVVIFKPAKK